MRKDILSTLKKTVIVPFNISSEDHLDFLIIADIVLVDKWGEYSSQERDEATWEFPQ